MYCYRHLQQGMMPLLLGFVCVATGMSNSVSMWVLWAATGMSDCGSSASAVMLRVCVRVWLQASATGSDASLDPQKRGLPIAGNNGNYGKNAQLVGACFCFKLGVCSLFCCLGCARCLCDVLCHCVCVLVCVCMCVDCVCHCLCVPAYGACAMCFGAGEFGYASGLCAPTRAKSRQILPLFHMYPLCRAN
jgi:hypothetical protein